MTRSRSLPWIILSFSSVSLAFLILAPDALAQAGVLNPGCSGVDCQFCHLMTLADKIVKYLILLAVPIAAILFSYAGYLYMSSSGSEEKVSKAKNIFKDVLIGFVIAALGFTIVDTVIQTLGNGFFSGPSWRTISCVANRNTGGSGLGLNTSPGAPGTGGGGGVGVTPTPNQPTSGGSAGQSGTCTDCVTLDSSVPGYNRALSCASQSGGGCQVSAQIASGLQSLATDLQAANIGWQVTEAWPPTTVHQAGCHYNGTCVDASFVNTPATPQNISQFISVANSNGFRAQYEVASQPQADAIRAQAQATGVTLGSTDIIVVSGINGPHFSVYKK